MPDTLLGLAPRPLVLAAMIGGPEGLLKTYDRLSGRDQMGTHHWAHQTHVWYDALVFGAGAALELTNSIGTDASTTMMLVGLNGLAARYGNYLHSVVHPPGGGAAAAPLQARAHLVPPVPGYFDPSGDPDPAGIVPPVPVRYDATVGVRANPFRRRLAPLPALGYMRASAAPTV